MLNVTLATRPAEVAYEMPPDISPMRFRWPSRAASAITASRQSLRCITLHAILPAADIIAAECFHCGDIDAAAFYYARAEASPHDTMSFRLAAMPMLRFRIFQRWITPLAYADYWHITMLMLRYASIRCYADIDTDFSHATIAATLAIISISWLLSLSPFRHAAIYFLRCFSLFDITIRLLH